MFRSVLSRPVEDQPLQKPDIVEHVLPRQIQLDHSQLHIVVDKLQSLSELLVFLGGALLLREESLQSHYFAHPKVIGHHFAPLLQALVVSLVSLLNEIDPLPALAHSRVHLKCRCCLLQKREDLSSC